AYLQPGEKFDVNFTLRNNRTAAHIVGANGDAHPLDSAGVDRVEWLVATTPPPSSAKNHATGMSCSALPSDKDKDDISGQFSTALPASASDPAAVPANAAFGVYNLYLRAHAATSCTGTGEISPVYVLENAIMVAPRIRSIKVTPSQPPPQPPLTVGKRDVEVVWAVTFSAPVTGVDAGDFRLIASGASGAGITSVSGSGSVYYVTARVLAGGVPPDQLASLRLDFVDDDSVKSAAGSYPLGGPGAGNANFSGETQPLKGTICGAANVIWCDDFERSVQGASQANLVGNGWVAASTHTTCAHTPGSNYQPDAGGCAGIDSDIKPYHDYANLRANESRSMFNRWREHTVTSEVIDLSGLPAGSAVEYSYWLRRGDDVFAEKPELSTDYFKAEYLDKDGAWQQLAAHRSAGGKAVAGEALRPMFQLPDAALWSGFRLRFTQNHGDGILDRSSASKVNGYDYWFVDDVVLRRIDAPRYAGGFCDNFEAPEASLKQWSFNHEDAATGALGSGIRIGEAGVTGDVYPTQGSTSHSLFLRWSYVAASSLRIDTSAMTGGVPVSYVMQRGLNSKPPDTINGAPVYSSCDYNTAQSGDRFVSEYFADDNKWHTLQDVDGVDGSSRCGENFRYSKVIEDPAARHDGFRLRFRQISTTSGQNNNDYNDYWLVDDVCVGRTLDQGLPKADLALEKTRETAQLLPGGVVVYVLRAANNGPDTMRGDLQIVDTLPAGMSFHAFQGLDWFCEAAGQRVSCAWSGELAQGQAAPDLRIYAVVAETASGTLTNRAALSSGAVVDGNSDNDGDTDEGDVETVSFLFTKGQCADGEQVGGVASSAPCSRYDFGGLAGEHKRGIRITHVDAGGRYANALSGSADAWGVLQFALRCLDPAGPPPQGAVQALFGTDVAPSRPLSACARSGDASLPWSDSSFLAVMFTKGAATADGVYGFRYEDVGRVRLYVRDLLDDSRQGGSEAFVQKPAALALKEVRCEDGTPNPGATAANGAPFCRAGQPFELTAEAQSVDGNRTPNFGQENTPKGVFLEKTLLLPQGGHDPDLGLRGLGAFTNGAATVTAQSWTEVGIIAITPRLGDVGDGGMTLSDQYLGAGDVPPEGLQTVIIGRFYPGHFQTSIGAEGRMACPSGMTCPEGGFFYTGQPFALSVKACPHGDESCAGRLENYRGDFAATVKLSAWGARGSEEAADQNPPDFAANGGYLEGVALGGATIPGDGFAGGDGFGGLFTGLFRYAHALKTHPVAPVDIYIRAVEDGRDGVSSRFSGTPDSSPEGGIKLARGRVQLSNGFGPAKNALAIPVQVQFWSCLESGQCDWTVSATDMTRIEPDAVVVDADKRAALSVSLHPMQGMDAMPEVDRLELSGGAGRIVLLPKGGEGSLNVGINLGEAAEDNACDHTAGGQEGAAAKLPWLRAWNGVCTQAQSGEADPSARATFGIYSGERRRSVHSRERY
ncbi:MAG: DUF11 domain-containing protein, partial [Azoarcus sp.]|nr:DUF11 domain-containing protein [Azoarcus sp.]